MTSQVCVLRVCVVFVLDFFLFVLILHSPHRTLAIYWSQTPTAFIFDVVCKYVLFLCKHGAICWIGASPSRCQLMATAWHSPLQKPQ